MGLPEDERSLLRRAGERLGSTFDHPDAFEAWREARSEGIRERVVAINDERLGRVPPPGMPPELQALVKAAGELQARVDAGAPVERGDRTSESWTLVASLDLEASLAFEPSHLWALSAPGGGLFVAATGAGAPEPRTLAEARSLAEDRMRAARLAEEFVRMAAVACPGEKARRLGSL